MNLRQRKEEEQRKYDEISADIDAWKQAQGGVRLPAGTYDLYADPDDADDVIVYHPSLPAPVAIHHRDLPTARQGNLVVTRTLSAGELERALAEIAADGKA